MGVAIREQIFATVFTAMGQITVPNGFRTNVRRVFRAGEFAINIPESPSIILDDESGDKRAIRLGIAYEDLLAIDIRAFLKQTDRNVKATEIAALQADIIEKAKEDLLWGDLATRTRIITESPLLSELQEPVAITLVRLLIRYNTHQLNPDIVVPLL